jgi:hypothetical protein
MRELWDPKKFYNNSKHSRKNAYIWDPTEFYDDLKHYIFLNNTYMWDQGLHIGSWWILWRLETPYF